MAEETGDGRRCDFCRLPCPERPVEAEYDGDTYRFCSAACREAMADSDRVFTEYRGYRRFDTGVAGLDRGLPQGMLRGSLVLLTAQAGTREGAVETELVWRALRRGEPAVVVSFQEPPVSVVERFLTLDWNVLPYLENGQLHVVDCLTYRLDDPERMHDRMNDWNRYLREVVEPATTTVRDPTDVRELENKIDDCLEAREMVDTGVVMIDSLTELGTLVQPVRAYNFVKDLRADVCKGRYVPVFAGATFSGDTDAFPHDLDYTADGVVDLELTDDLVADTLLKRARIRKMNGVLSVSEWTPYEYTGGRGMVPFDPAEEMAKAAEGEAAAAAEDDGDDGSAAPGDPPGDDRDGGTAADPDGDSPDGPDDSGASDGATDPPATVDESSGPDAPPPSEG
jgi:KaiC/GvpD/RAD55 family RecA-like ATPase